MGPRGVDTMVCIDRIRLTKFGETRLDKILLDQILLD